MDFVLSIILIILLIVFLVISHMKKQVLYEHGEIYKKVMELNNQYTLEKFYYSRRHTVYVESKPKLDRLNLSEIAMECYYNDSYNLKSEHDRLKRLKRDYDSYVEKYNKIVNVDPGYRDIDFCETIFKFSSKFAEYEQKKVASLKKKFKYRFRFTVYGSYTSPRGRNHWYKTNDFSEIDFDDFIDIINRRTEYERSAKFQRSLMSDSLRYDVLKLDNFICQICGISAKDGAKLEVDHIIPVSRGGKTNMGNLQTLCERCNRGKSNKD